MDMQNITKASTQDSEIKTLKIPHMMTVREVAKTGILPENTIRVLLKSGYIPAVYSGKTAYIRFEALCDFLNNLKPEKAI